MCIATGLALGSIALSSCSSGGGGSPGVGPVRAGVQLAAVQHGKLVDVYGLASVGGNIVTELYQSDVVVGLDIQDERDASSNKADSEILYDYINSNPDTLQPRLLITRIIGSKEFAGAFAALDRNLRLVSPTQWGRDPSKAPYSVVPRNAAIRLTFSGDLGITDDDLYARDANGKITRYKNSEAIQLLKITGNPNDNKYEGDFQVIDTRIVVRGNQVIIDPVLLGTEGLIYGSRNAASGMPEAPDQLGANIRIAIALEGQLAIRGVGADKIGTIRGRNNDGFRSVVRDFRSGNSADNSAHLSRGFIRDPQPPRLIGQMLMYLASVEDVSSGTKLLTIFKNDIEHEIDRGDLFRIYSNSSGVPVASVEVLQDPQDDFGRPEEPYVRVLVRPVIDAKGEDLLEKLDPANLPGYPGQGPELDAFLRKHAPRSVLLAEFTYRRVRPNGGPNPYYGDDPRNFLTFNPTPLPDDSGNVIANDNVSPFAGAIVRFTKPIDMTTLIALDTVFFATRNVLDDVAINKFIRDRKIDPAKFNKQKFRTPHLIHSRIFDEDGSQTAIRVQPTLGFYLDNAMRAAAAADKNLPFSQRRYHYFLHLVGGPEGVRDLSGNPLDLQAVPVAGLEIADKLVMEFGVESRYQPGSKTLPRFDDNIVSYIVRRFADPDEDERPNLYLPGEVTPDGGLTPADAYRNQDFFGPIGYANGELIGRPTSRVTKIVDNLNQLPPPAQSTNLRWCPQTVYNRAVFTDRTGATVFSQPIQNPLNPYGCRLQTAWRELDMSLSRIDPLDFNLDVEQMYYGPFAGNAIYFDEFDKVTMYLGHSEYRPEPCASLFGIAVFPNSGLKTSFWGNYAQNLSPTRKIEFQPAAHPAFVDKVFSINAKDAILDPTASNRFIPLPKFEDASKATGIKNEYFVWRDEQVNVQGGVNFLSPNQISPYPYLLSPFLGGKGRAVTGGPGNPIFNDGGWFNARNVSLSNGAATDNITQGLVGPLALPLLMDFWSYPDSPEKPIGNPFVATGVNGWQISLPVRASATPNFRVYSAGRGGSNPIRMDPSKSGWSTASGGYTPFGGRTRSGDNSVYWIMTDFLKRTAVATFGFVEIANPHRMPKGSDPRLGPYNVGALLPDFAVDFEPPLSTLPAGTSVVPEFRGASVLDWQSNFWPAVGNNRTDANNYPLDPRKAGDAWVRHWDDRGGRNWWTYLYNRTVTSYAPKMKMLMDVNFTSRVAGPREPFEPKDVKYFNWRFIMKNNVEASPPVSPRFESFAISYRFVPGK